MFHFIFILTGEGFYVPDLCELTFANTLLLSNAGSKEMKRLKLDLEIIPGKLMVNEKASRI